MELWIMDKYWEFLKTFDTRFTRAFCLSTTAKSELLWNSQTPSFLLPILQFNSCEDETNLNMQWILSWQGFDVWLVQQICC